LEHPSNGGFVNAGNALFCRLKVNLKITGVTPSQGVTGSYTSPNNTSTTY